MQILFWIFLTLFGFAIMILLRNERVYTFRRRLSLEVNTIARREVALKFLVELLTVPYQDMVFKFWKPLRSFYSEDILKLLDD